MLVALESTATGAGVALSICSAGRRDSSARSQALGQADRRDFLLCRQPGCSRKPSSPRLRARLCVTAFGLTEEFWFSRWASCCGWWLSSGLPRPQMALCVRSRAYPRHLGDAPWRTGSSHFMCSADGGHVLADRTNTWIALAPYFFPIYSVLAIGVYGVCGLFLDVAPYRSLLYAVIGATWAMHLSFTCWMIPKGQPDLHYGGTFFSLMVIYVRQSCAACGAADHRLAAGDVGGIRTRVAAECRRI